MRIGIDARFWGLENTGIGRYLMGLVENLQKIDSQNKYFLFFRHRHYQPRRFRAPNFQSRLADFPHYSLSEQINFPRLLEKEALDLVHFPNFNFPLLYRGRFVVTIHDLIKHYSKGMATTTRSSWLYYPKYLAYLATIHQAALRSRRIITPSLFWQKKICQQFSLPQKKVKVVYEGVGICPFPNSWASGKNLFASLGIKFPFIVYTGNLYPHKNILNLVRAVQRINLDSPLYLVIISSKNVFWQRLKMEINKLGAGDLVILAGFLSDQEMSLCYQKAQAFVLPSLYEGFGLTGLEAMSCGLPVLASDSSCLPEIYGPAARYFNPLSPEDIAQKIKEIIFSLPQKRQLLKKGAAQIKKYRFAKMAQETLAIYKEAVSS